MDDVKDKMKGFIKKVTPSSSSNKFKGQGRVLGSSSSSPANSNPSRLIPPTQPTRPIPNSTSQSPNPAIPSPQDRKSTAGFDPFDPLITSSQRSVNGLSATLFDCPVCSSSFPSEAEVSAHIDSCLVQDHNPVELERSNDVAACIGVFMSGEPAEESMEILLKLLRNVVREPGNEKFRRIRMGNPKIKEAVGAAKGGVELLECVGFRLGEDGGEVWATMEVPSDEQIAMIKEAISLLEQWKSVDSKPVAPPTVATERKVEQKKIDRQVRVFFSVPESVAAKIDLPESFYNLSIEEIRREAETRKKKMAESQLLIPKSYKEKQAMTARKKYKLTVIRIQFPDGVVLQGVFLPLEPTTALYEFVSSALKEASLEFELHHPVLPKLRVIPRFPRAGDKRTPTLEEEYLVPSALIKFKPIETDSIVFTGLTNELLEASEPLTSTTSTLL